MRRAFSITLLAASLLLAASAQARGGGMRGGGARAVLARGGGGHGGLAGNSRARGFRSNRFGNNNLGNNLGNDALLYPGWYDEPYDGEEAGPPEESGPPLMPPMMGPRPTARRVTAGPKITEVPGTAEAAAVAPALPAEFILTSGERIEARQYLVTYNQVQLTVDRQPRTIPLSMLDVNATLAADRQRGIDLHIPSGQNEVSLGF